MARKIAQVEPPRITYGLRLTSNYKGQNCLTLERDGRDVSIMLDDDDFDKVEAFDYLNYHKSPPNNIHAPEEKARKQSRARK